MIYLIEIEAHDGVGVTVLRYGDTGYTTQPGDDPADTYFEPRIVQPGNYERSIFDQGRTSGEARVGAGEIVLANPDGELDALIGYAFDGHALRIFGLASADAPWASRTLLFRGTVEQAEFSWRRVTLRIRDRLAELREPIQTAFYAGTTVSGGMTEAEGRPEDLKDRPKPLLFGVARNVPAIQANIFDHIYQVSSDAFAAVLAVYDRGVALAATGDHATLAALLAASLTGGNYATCLALGVIRIGGSPVGEITVDVVEGATSGARTAGQIVRRILIKAGMVEDVDFLASDIDALDGLNAAEVGIWLGTEETATLNVVTAVLDSIGAYIVPNRLGVFRIGRVDAATETPVATFDENMILDRGAGIERIATNDQGGGVPAHKVTIRYQRNYATADANQLAGSATSQFIAFSEQQWRTATSEDPAVKARHLLAPELEFESLIDDADAAGDEADRRLGLYSVRRDRMRAPLKSEYAAEVDLGDVITLMVPRFDMTDGKDFVVLGMEEDYERGLTVLEVWG